jgi:hypothetical protein
MRGSGVEVKNSLIVVVVGGRLRCRFAGYLRPPKHMVRLA